MEEIEEMWPMDLNATKFVSDTYDKSVNPAVKRRSEPVINLMMFRTQLCAARILLLSVSFLILTATKQMTTILAAQGREPVRSEVRDNGWESVFFREINGRAQIAKLDSLRTTSLGENDLELRLWIGFGPTALKGFVIKRHGARWSATYLKPIRRSSTPGDDQQALNEPKSGWDGFWKHIADHGILTLPGSNESNWTDGESFVVEVKRGAIYRTYMYDNPQFRNSAEDRKILEIVDIIRNEFGVAR